MQTLVNFSLDIGQKVYRHIWDYRNKIWVVDETEIREMQVRVKLEGEPLRLNYYYYYEYLVGKDIASERLPPKNLWATWIDAVNAADRANGRTEIWKSE